LYDTAETVTYVVGAAGYHDCWFGEEGCAGTDVSADGHWWFEAVLFDPSVQTIVPGEPSEVRLFEIDLISHQNWELEEKEKHPCVCSPS
jgi:hypothetical protein